MQRRARFIPDNDGPCLVEVSSRTVQGLALLTPTERVCEVIVGVFGRALEVSPLGIAGLSFASNHYHGLLIVDDQQQLSHFMNHVQTNLSKEVGLVWDWRNGLWSRRYDSIIVSNEPEEQWRRLKYLLAHDYASYCTSLVAGWLESSRKAARSWSRTSSGVALVVTGSS